MPSFDTSGSAARTPFGKNQYLRSTKNVKKESYTCAAGGVPVETIDGDATQKVLQPGTVMAKITSGPDAGKIGVFDRGAAGGVAAVNEVQKVTVATSGNTTVSFEGVAAPATALTADASGATALTALLEGLPDIDPGDVAVVAGSGGDAGKLIVTFGGRWAGRDVPSLAATGTGASVATGTAGAAGTEGAGAPTDGRQLFANIVGLVDTFLPWQLRERDVEVAVTQEAEVVQGWCFEYANGVRIALTNGTRDAIIGLALTRLLRFV